MSADLDAAPDLDPMDLCEQCAQPFPRDGLIVDVWTEPEGGQAAEILCVPCRRNRLLGLAS